MAKLYFYYSAMNAGKSTTLLQSDYNYRERGMDTVLFTPELDNRHQTGVIASRIGLQANAISFNMNSDLYAIVEQIKQQRPALKCIFVDEAQFLNKQQVYQLTAIVDTLGLPVLTYGLRSDFKAEPFEGSLYLLILAEEIIEIKTICHCGRKATMNMRIDEKGQKVSAGAQIEIGGNDRYIATCRIHFNEGNSGQNERAA
ncbi:MAG: thymidine kinase [Gammaproteobacteria bacterium]|nr:thymidine kinase [Gammaproteobacteria bacterium]